MQFRRFSWRSLSLLSGLLLLLLSPPGESAGFPVRKIDLSTPADQLPYELKCLKSVRGGAPLVSGNKLADIDGDGNPELLSFFSDLVQDRFYRSTLLVYSDPLRQEFLSQYNGKYEWARIWDCFCLDVAGGPGEEAILLKVIADTVLFEIVSYDSACQFADTFFVPAAIGTGLKLGGEWHDINVHPLAAIDVNGDGIKDLIYIRSAKPDSAFARGIVAYDLKKGEQIWFYPTADAVGGPNFHVIPRPDTSPCFAFNTMSCGNLYAANGMDSRHAYAAAIDINGSELWRYTIGGEFFYPGSLPLDVNNDGIEEMCATVQTDIDSSESKLFIQCYDAFTGAKLLCSDSVTGSSTSSITRLTDSLTGVDCIFWSVVVGDSPRTYRLDKRLKITEGVLGTPVGFGVDLTKLDLNGDGHSEIIGRTYDGKLIVLDQGFSLLASAELNGTLRIFDRDGQKFLFMDNGVFKWDVLAMQKRGLVALAFTRYKVWFEVIAAALLALGIFHLGRAVVILRVSALGLPSLDKINAMVLVLDRKGRVIYVNSNPLVMKLLGNDFRRRQIYGDTALARFPGVVESIRKSYNDPLLPLQERFDIGDENGEAKIELVIYPRIDKSNTFLGKILVAEDVTGKIGWERKAVMGEAAQRWVHKLKGSMATARLFLENLREDPRVAKSIAEDRIVSQYLSSIGAQIDDTAETAGKILRFARITKPELISDCINRIVDKAVSPYLATVPGGVTVAKKQQADLPAVKIDPEQMVEVLDNLLSNAVRAVAAGGKVTIHTRLATDLHNGKSMNNVELIVEDTGIGIDAADIDRVFLPGFSRSAGGTGIGLAVVKEIVDNHGGQVFVESEVGKGSRLTVRLPVEDKNHG